MTLERFLKDREKMGSKYFEIYGQQYCGLILNGKEVNKAQNSSTINEMIVFYNDGTVELVSYDIFSTATASFFIPTFEEAKKIAINHLSKVGDKGSFTLPSNIVQALHIITSTLNDEYRDSIRKIEAKIK